MRGVPPSPTTPPSRRTDLPAAPFPDGNPFRYCGEYFDDELGTVYLRARYYDPGTGRFLSEDTHWNPENMIFGDNPLKINDHKDPLGLNAYTYVPDIYAIMQSGNLYAYCVNNPIMFHDQSGELIGLIIAGIIIGAIVGATIGYGIAQYFNVPEEDTWKYVLGGAIVGSVMGGCIGYSIGSSFGSGIVLWSGKGMAEAASSFATYNGLKTIGQTLQGKLLNVLDNTFRAILGDDKAHSIMKSLWDAASSRFVASYSGDTSYVHVFITSQAYNDMASTFNRVEMAVIYELGLKIIWHFVE